MPSARPCARGWRNRRGVCHQVHRTAGAAVRVIAFLGGGVGRCGRFPAPFALFPVPIGLERVKRTVSSLLPEEGLLVLEGVGYGDEGGVGEELAEVEEMEEVGSKFVLLLVTHLSQGLDP